MTHDIRRQVLYKLKCICANVKGVSVISFYQLYPLTRNMESWINTDIVVVFVLLTAVYTIISLWKYCVYSNIIFRLHVLFILSVGRYFMMNKYVNIQNNTTQITSCYWLCFWNGLVSPLEMLYKKFLLWTFWDTCLSRFYIFVVSVSDVLWWNSLVHKYIIEISQSTHIFHSFST